MGIIRRRARRADLERKVDELQERLHRVEAGGPPPQVSRRRLLGLAGAAAAGGVAGVVASASPAAATTGAMQYGAANDAGTDTTSLTSTNGAATLLSTNTAATQDVVGIAGVTSGGGSLRAFGVSGTSNSAAGVGVAGERTAGAGLGRGVTGTSESTGGIGVSGDCAAGSGATIGVKGEANSSDQGIGVSGEGGLIGVFGKSSGVAGIGIWADGALAPLRLVPHVGAGAPTTGTHQKGELYTDNTGGDIFYCRLGGTPGTWSKLNDQSVAGGVGLNILAAPSRIYDSRIGFLNPSGATQGPLAFGAAARVIDCTQTTPNLPATAFGLLLNLTATGTAGPTAGALLVWANGQSEPVASSINWTSAGQTLANACTTACDNQQRIQVRCVASAGSSTNFILDVIGYYSSP